MDEHGVDLKSGGDSGQSRIVSPQERLYAAISLSIQILRG